MTDPIIIAIGGTRSSGKGTLARRIADYLGFAYLDTGLLYRAVAYALISNNISIDNNAAAIQAAQMLAPAMLEKAELRSGEIGKGASVVAAIPEVRDVIFDFQQSFPAASGKPGAVIHGRDVGTVIFSEAAIKFFIDADQKVRSERRWNDLLTKGEKVTFESVYTDMQASDACYAGGADVPIAMAEDSIFIDTSEMDIESTLAMMFIWIPQDQPHLVEQFLDQNIETWKDQFSSLKELSDHVLSTTPLFAPGGLWTFLEHTYLPLSEEFVAKYMHNPKDPLCVKVGSIINTLRSSLTQYCRDIALPDCEKLSDKGAAHPGDPESHIIGGVFDEEIEPLMAMMPCQQAALLNPQMPRFWFQYARVLFAANRWHEGFNHLMYAANMGHGGALAYLADFALDDSFGLGLDPMVAKPLYEQAKASQFWLAEEVGEQIEEVSPDAMAYIWNSELHEDIEYNHLNILIQLSNGIPATDSKLPPEYILCYVVATLSGIRKTHVWMVNSTIIPDMMIKSGSAQIMHDIDDTIRRAASGTLQQDALEEFREKYFNDEFQLYLNQGYQDGIAFAKAEGPDSGALELYIQTVTNLYFYEVNTQGSSILN